MAPGKKSKPTEVQRDTEDSSSDNKPKSFKGKRRVSTKNAAPKRPIPSAVLKYAKKRNFEIAEEDSEDDGTNKPSKRRKKKNSNKKLWGYDDFTHRELPPSRDYGATFAAKSTAHYTWGVPSLVFSTPPPIGKEPEKANTPTKNKGKGKEIAKPGRSSVPTQSDGGGGGSSSSAANPESSKRGPLGEKKGVEETTKAVKEVGNIPNETSFLLFPLEIRQRVYRYLLVADNPVRVRQGWSAVYPRNRPCLETSILRVCRQVRNEAINTLYGENQFLYLLRETISPPTTDEFGEDEIVVQHPSIVVENRGSGYDDNSDAEYTEDEGSTPIEQSTQDPQVEIDIRRFGHKFRHIKVVAEPNRTEKGYLLSMANAISVFRNLKPLRPRIHTIAIEITPRYDDDIGDLTFLNFFENTSEVTKALRGLPCQFIEIYVNTSETSQECIRVNMKYAANLRRARRGEKDPWEGDVQMKEYRSLEAGKAQRQIDTLPSLIREAWQKDNAEFLELQKSDGEDTDDDLLWGQDYD